MKQFWRKFYTTINLLFTINKLKGIKGIKDFRQQGGYELCTLAKQGLWLAINQNNLLDWIICCDFGKGKSLVLVVYFEFRDITDMNHMILVTTATDNGRRWSFPFPHFSSSSSSSIKLSLHKPNGIVVASSNSKSKAKQANLFASRTQRVELPVFDESSSGAQPYHISHFLSHTSGIQAILNTRALQNFQFLDTNAYR